MKDSDIDIRPDWNTLAHFEPEFHAACIIADDGSETPITEHMVQEAFAMLISEWDSGRGGGPKRSLEKSQQTAIHTASIGS